MRTQFFFVLCALVLKTTIYSMNNNNDEIIIQENPDETTSDQINELTFYSNINRQKNRFTGSGQTEAKESFFSLSTANKIYETSKPTLKLVINVAGVIIPVGGIVWDSFVTPSKNPFFVTATMGLGIYSLCRLTRTTQDAVESWTCYQQNNEESDNDENV